MEMPAKKNILPVLVLVTGALILAVILHFSGPRGPLDSGKQQTASASAPISSHGTTSQTITTSPSLSPSAQETSGPTMIPQETSTQISPTQEPSAPEAPTQEPSAPEAPTEEPPARETSPREPTVPSEPVVPTETYISGEALDFPLVLKNENLLIDPPFSYDGPNPDCGLEEGRNIAAISVKNCSGRHLIRADLTLVLADGTEIPFCIEHIPSGRRVTAFAMDNSVLPADAEWTLARVSARFAERESLRGNGVSIHENGMRIDVTNNTGAELNRLMIYCHNLLGEEYFGGKAYPYEINNIPAGGTVTAEAWDCFLGITEAAYTAEKQE